MRKNPKYVEIKDKELLTFEEAQALTGIGITKIRALVDNPDCDFVLKNGRKHMIFRVKFLEYLQKVKQI